MTNGISAPARQYSCDHADKLRQELPRSACPGDPRRNLRLEELARVKKQHG